MLFLFCLKKIKPSKRILKCFAYGLTMILLSLISLTFGITNIIGLFNFGGFEKEYYFYLYFAYGIVIPFIFIYCVFYDDISTQSIGYYLHSVYVILSDLAYLIIIIFLMIKDPSFLSQFSLAFTFLGVHVVFVNFANYIYYSFHEFGLDL